MDVLVANQITALNGTTVKIGCTFTSCYKVDSSKFAMNWSYQETANDTEGVIVRQPYTLHPVDMHSDASCSIGLSVYICLLMIKLFQTEIVYCVFV